MNMSSWKVTRSAPASPMKAGRAGWKPATPPSPCGAAAGKGPPASRPSTAISPRSARKPMSRRRKPPTGASSSSSAGMPTAGASRAGCAWNGASWTPPPTAALSKAPACQDRSSFARSLTPSWPSPCRPASGRRPMSSCLQTALMWPAAPSSSAIPTLRSNGPSRPN